MQLTKAQAKLTQDAQAAGYTVEHSATSVDIYKTHKRTGKVLRGIRLCEDGIAFRLDIELAATTAIRTQKVMRQILAI